MFKPTELFDLKQTEHAGLFEGCEYPWEVLRRLADYVRENVRPILYNRCEGGAFIGRDVFIGKGSVVEDGVMIKGPAIIGENCQIRHNAYIRENVIVGNGCVVGNATELKNCLLFNEVEVPHFNYVGDSILGFGVHLGAGVKISNLKIGEGTVTVEIDGRRIDTGLRKFGALLGDGVEVGCNAVLNPGTIVGPRTLIYPNTCIRGVIEADAIVKNRAAVEVTKRQQVSATVP